MPTQPSKEATQVKDLGDFVVVGTRTQNGLSSPLLDGLYAPVVQEDEQKVDFSSLQEYGARLLVGSGGEVTRTDGEHRRLLAQESRLLGRRNRLVSRCKGWTQDMDGAFSSHHGPEAAQLVGLDGPSPRTFVGTRDHTLDVAQRMKDPALPEQLGESRSGLPVLNPAELVPTGESLAGELTDVMGSIQGVRKRLDESLVKKRQALKRHRRLYLNLARLQEAFYRLVELDDLAERFRPVARTPRRSAQQQPPEVTEP